MALLGCIGQFLFTTQQLVNAFHPGVNAALNDRLIAGLGFECAIHCQEC